MFTLEGLGPNQRFSRIAVQPTLILKTLGSTESTTRPGKGGVGVGGNGSGNGGYDNGGGCSGDFDRKFHPMFQYNSRAIHLSAQDKLMNRLIN